MLRGESYNGYQSSGTMTWSTGSSSASGAVVTWTGSATAAFTLSHNKQIRWTSIEVTYSKEATTDPYISVDPTAVDFGTILNDFGYAEESFTLKGENLTGNVNLEITGSFKIAATNYPNGLPSLTVIPNAGAIDTTITLIAYKGTTGTFNNTLSITSEVSEFEDVEMALTLRVVSPVTSYDIDFETNFVEAYTNWDFVNIASASTAITAHGGTYYGNTGGKTTASITTKAKVALPGTLTFYTSKESTNTTASNWTVSVSADGSVWEDVASFDATTGDKGEWTERTADLKTYSNVFVRIAYGNSGAVRAIDDISLAMREAAEVEKPTIIGQTPFYPSTTVTMDIVTEGADIIYTIGGADPVGGDNTYTEPLVLTETHTIKARGFKGVKLGEVVTKTFTKATPITVAAAIEAIPNNNDVVDDTFVTGYVCTAGESVAGGQMTYYISADGTETNRLQVYKGKNLNNTDFSAVGDLAIGDKVVVYGQLKNYNGTPEMNSGNYIVERIAKGAVASVSLSGALVTTEYDYEDYLDRTGLVATANYENGYHEDVTELATWTVEGQPIAEKKIYGGQTTVEASYGGEEGWMYIYPTIKTYAVTFTQPAEGGTFAINYAGTAISSGDKHSKKAMLVVSPSPAVGYMLGAITVRKASDNSDVTAEVLNNKEITMPNFAIIIAVTFEKKKEGKLTITPNVIDYGSVTVGSSVIYKSFTLSGTGFTKDAEHAVYLTAPAGFSLSMTSIGGLAFNDDGSFGPYSIDVMPSSATLSACGVKDGNVVISADDMDADSLVAVKLTVVEPVVPSVEVTVYGGDKTLIDFGNVDKGASVSQVNISLVGHNLTGDVKVTVANATSTEVFVTNGFRPSNTYYQDDGEIDAAVIVIPKTSTAGEYTGTITFHSLTGDFEDIVIPLHINIKPDAGLSWSTENATAYTVAKPYTLPVLTNPHGVTVAYSSSDETVAKFDGSDNLDVLKDGETVITASFAGNSDYVAQEVSYTLTVRKPTAIRLDGDMATKEYEQGDHVSIAGYTVNAIFGGDVYDIYDVTGEATWTLDGKDIAIQTVSATTSYSLEATWNGFTAWEYVNLVRKTHAVTFNNPEHGRLTVTEGGGTFISGTKFAKGRVLTITLTPDLNYTGSVTVNGEPLEGNTYTIGTEDVNIIATFTAIPPVFTIENAPGNEYRFPETKKGSEPLSFDIVFNGLYLTGDVQVLVETMSGPRNDLFVIDDNLTSKTYSPVNGQITNATVHIVAKTDVAVPWNTTGYVRFKSLSGDFAQQNVQLYVTVYEGRVYVEQSEGGTVQVFKDGSSEPIVSGAEQYDKDTKFYVVATPDNDYTLGGVFVSGRQIWAPYNFWSTYTNQTINAAFNLKPEAPISWSADEANVIVGAEDPVFPTLTNDETLDVVFSSTDEDVATIAADGIITLHAIGETTIGATFTSSSSSAYRTTTVEYTLTVSEQSDPTAIDNATATEKTIKFIENGHLYIRRGDKTYNGQGAMVK